MVLYQYLSSVPIKAMDFNKYYFIYEIRIVYNYFGLDVIAFFILVKSYVVLSICNVFLK